MKRTVMCLLYLDFVGFGHWADGDSPFVVLECESESNIIPSVDRRKDSGERRGTEGEGALGE